MTARDRSASLPLPLASTEVRRLVDSELSLPSRLGYVALLLGALAMTSVVTALWLTEPALPLRTRIAFAVMVLIGSSWVAFASWVLTHRRALLGRQRIIAGRMSVTFTTVFLVFALVFGVTLRSPASFAAAGMGGVLLLAALTLLARAHRHVARLTERRQVLENQLGRRGR